MTKTTLPYFMSFDLGDWSNDGHGKTQTVFLRSNFTMEDIAIAYKSSCKESGIIFHEEVASKYEDLSMPAEKFLELGMDREIVCYENDPSLPPSQWRVSCYYKHYLALFIEFCKLSLSDLILKEDEEFPDLRDACANEHFGYGIFY